MRRVLVTGANKGIGLAIARAIVEEHDDTFVFLGSRDRARGEEAARSIVADDAKRAARIEVVALDVADDASVKAASEAVRARLGKDKLYGIVNNAGVNAPSGEPGALARTLEVNAVGPRRVCEAFLPLLDERGRVVIVSSASGPNFVAKCSPERKAFLVDGERTWPELRALVDECIALGDKAKLESRGLGDGSAYGLSKAIVNAYMMLLAREHPSLRVNACTPGFIETDMTRHYVDPGKTAAEVGMKPPSAGARAPMFLLFGEPEGNGRYYGSDAKRSPLDRYREPGSPAYTGD